MPPKKKPAKKGKGDTEEDELKAVGKTLNNEINTIQQRIVLEESKANRSNENVEKYRKLELEIKAQIDKEKNEKDRITFTMADEIKRMEDTMMKQIKIQEEIVSRYEQELKDRDEQIEKLQKGTEEELKYKKEEIRQLKNNMEMMSSEFMGMLKITLDKMKSRIDTAGSTDLIKESEAIMMKKLEEFTNTKKE